MPAEFRPVASQPPGIFAFQAPNHGGVVLRVPMPYTVAREHHMALLNKIFTTRTLLQIIFVLTATLMMKAASLHYDFSWATAFAGG